jgi:anthranilate/para-aminobenzoate synthase component II
MNFHPRILFVDHADSFSDNLIAALRARSCEVERVMSFPAGDVSHQSLPERLQALWSSGAFHALVLSPGPLRPESYTLSQNLLDQWPSDRPVLGVCLGHQMLLSRDGLPLMLVAERPVHGRREKIEPAVESSWLKGFADHGFATFYNSWAVNCSPLNSAAGSCPWRLLARNGDFVALAEHKTRPWMGVQYHPESFSSQRGAVLLDAFVALVQGCALD